jgi:sensory rhodopsin
MMTDLTVSMVRFGFAGVYILTFLAMGLFVRRTPDQLRQYGYLLTILVGVAPIAILLQELGIGQLPASNGTLDFVNLVQGTVSTLVIYGLVLSLADVSRSMTGFIIFVALIPTYAGAIAGLLGDSISGVLGLLFLGGFFVPFPVILYLFFRPVWRSAQTVSRQRRLVHWKARNILLFAYGMLLAYTPMAIAGLITDPILDIFVLEYSIYFLYGGVAAYLLYNLVGLEIDEEMTTGVPGD